MPKRRGRTPKLGVKLGEYYGLRLTASLLKELDTIAKMVKLPAPVIARRGIFLLLEALGNGEDEALAWVKHIKENGEELR